MSDCWKAVIDRGTKIDSEVILFYDENRAEVVKEIKKYVRANGFSVKTKNGIFTIRTILLRHAKLTGEKLEPDKMYHEIFDAVTGEETRVLTRKKGEKR